MMNNEIKMPANFAAIDENEMVYLQGGATTEATAWDVFLNVGKLFNYIARVFSAGSSIVNNINVIVTTFQTLSTFSLTAKNEGLGQNRISIHRASAPAGAGALFCCTGREGIRPQMQESSRFSAKRADCPLTRLKRVSYTNGALQETPHPRNKRGERI